MQKSFALLIKRHADWLIVALILVFACVAAKAEEVEFSQSGYATYTVFEKQDFYPDSGTIAENFSVRYGSLALKGQIANSEYEPIRRLALEYSTGVFGDNFTVQAGRLPRLATLESDVYGSPAEWDMAVLPMAGYNRRKVHSLAFQTVEGVKAIWDHGTDWGSVRVMADTGKAIQERDCEWQREMFKACATGYDFVGDNLNNHDLSIEARIGSTWTILAAYNKVDLNTVLLNPADRTAAATVASVRGMDYRYTRLGLRYNASWGYVQAEHGENRLYYDYAKQSNALQSTARDDYIMGALYVTDSITGIIGYAHGQKRGSPFTSRDGFVGVVSKLGSWTLTAEHHDGIGSWARSDIQNIKYDWRSYALSATYAW